MPSVTNYFMNEKVENGLEDVWRIYDNEVRAFVNEMNEGIDQGVMDFIESMDDEDLWVAVRNLRRKGELDYVERRCFEKLREYFNLDMEVFDRTLWDEDE